VSRRIDDPELVREQYAREGNLHARAALWRDLEGPNPREVLFDTIAACRPGRVLEVGGGDGWLAAQLCDELDCDVTLVDQSERMVELAAARGIDAQLGDVQQLAFDDESFDTVVAAWMLYHVHDTNRGLGEIARVLEPGGRLVALTNSQRHCEEVFDLIAYPQSAREWTFRAENGEESLRPYFSTIERQDLVGIATVHDRETLVNYQRSMMTDTQPVPPDVELPLRVHARCAIFVATK